MPKILHMHKLSSITIVTLLFCLLSNVTIFAQEKIIDEVIAVVGDNEILLSDIEHDYQQALMNGMSAATGDLKCKLLEEKLKQKLMINQAILDSIEVDENNVINQVDARINQFITNAGGKEKLEEYFNEPLQQIKEEQMDYMRDYMRMQQMQSKIIENIKPTPSQVRAYYRKTPKDSLPMVPVQYEIQKIAVYPRIDQKEIDRVKNKLRDFQKQVAEGRDFATLAVLYSEDPGSATTGGDLGWATRGTFVPAFANVAFNMREKNKVSKIVETEYGYHIIQLLDRKGDRIHVRHILMKPKITPEANKEAAERLDSISKLIKDSSYTFEEAALKFSMDKDTRNNGGLMVNPNTQSSNFQLSAIRQPRLAKEVQKLDEGEISHPFKIQDEKTGQDEYVIVKQKRKIAPHKANISDDYQLIQSIMTHKEEQKTISDWITEKSGSTYITIDDDWKTCPFEFKNWIK